VEGREVVIERTIHPREKETEKEKKYRSSGKASE